MSMPLVQLVRDMPQSQIALVGDFMLDRYVFGHANRISPEAPVPVLHFQHEEQRLGGAGFVLAGLATLGARVRAVGVLGNDSAAQTVREQLQGYGADVSGLVNCQGRPTVTKMRLLGSSQERTPQQMLRLDFEDHTPCDEKTSQEAVRNAQLAIESSQMVCLEDYNKGVLTPAVTRQIIKAARERRIPIMVDPAYISDYGKYAGATCLKINRPETERATGLSVRSTEQYRLAAEKLLQMLDLEAVVITLNEQGAYLATAAGERRLVGARAREVADATGAGDIVLAMLCVARCSGASWGDAVTLANIAGGIEVERLGCVPVTRDEIVHDLLAEHEHPRGKERPIEELLLELSRHRSAGKKIVFTNGCFDLIHLGHVKYFQFAKQQGDILVVGVNTDASIRRLKGPRRPIISEADRVSVLEEFESIDYVARFDQDTPIDLIQAIAPDVLVKGADYHKEQVVGWDLVESTGGRVALAPLIEGQSTSSVIQRIIDAYK